VKFRVERDALGEAVSFVARALPTRPVVPVLSSLKVEADEDQLTLSCFDYEMSARVSIAADVGEIGTALVPGRLLAEITRSLPHAEVDVSTAAGMVMLTCGSAEFALVELPLDEYPALPALPPVAGTAPGQALATAAAQVAPSASRDDTLPMLTGVCLEFDGRELTLVATDRYRLAAATLPWEPAGPAVRASALVPARMLADVARSMGAGGPIAIAVGQYAHDGTRPADGVISFESDRRRLTARLIGTEFVRYQSRFPPSFEVSAELAAAPFIDAVRRVSLVADRVTPIQLEFRPGGVVIQARSSGRAQAIESLPARFDGTQPMMISFNPQYLLDGITAAAMSGAGRIRIQFSSPAKPALISWIDGDATAGAAVDDPPRPATTKPGGNGAASVAPGSLARGAARDEPTPADAATFRYLVVPLRAPAGG